jgi:teichuronic acid biosynthesis glycosyltransferase TuaC
MNPPLGVAANSEPHSGFRGLKIISLCTVFPNPARPGTGPFVRARLQAMACGAEVKVIAPVPVLDYSSRGSGTASIPASRWDGPIEVLHPRWFYPPLGGASNGFWLFLRLAPVLLRLRRRFRFDVVDAHFGHPDGVAASLLGLLLKCPVTVTLRGSEIDHSLGRFRRAAIGWSLRRAARVIAVSDNLRGLAVSMGVPEERISKIPNGVDAVRFSPRDRQQAREKFGIAPDRRMIFSAGHLIELKGHHRTVRALHYLVQQGVDAELLIAGGAGGGSPYENSIRREIEACGVAGRVRFLGQVPPDALAELMSAADVFCLASRREGWPNVVHEALSCGTPVVATRVGGILDMIPDENVGLTVPLNEQEMLNHSLHRALQKTWDREAISRWGRSRSWQDVAGEVLELMGQVVAAAGGIRA